MKNVGLQCFQAVTPLATNGQKLILQVVKDTIKNYPCKTVGSSIHLTLYIEIKKSSHIYNTLYIHYLYFV